MNTKNDRQSFLVVIAAKPIAVVRMRKLAVIKSTRDAEKFISIAYSTAFFWAKAPNTYKSTLITYKVGENRGKEI